MTLFLTYELKVAVLIAVFYIFWRLLVAKETWHRLNRIVLLSTAIASFVLPLCVLTIHQTVKIDPIPMEAIELAAPSETDEIQAITAAPFIEKENPFNWQLTLILIYIIGMLVVLSKIILSLWRLHRMTIESEIHPLADGRQIAVCDKAKTPFSWWNTVFLNHQDYEEGTTALLTHELEHIRLHHSADVLLVELLTTLQWFNPVMWMLRADLRTIHEYQADQQVLSHGFNDIQYLKLLIRKAAVQGGYSLANGINNSTLRKRVTMIMKPKSNSNSKLKLFALVPIVGICLALNANTVIDYVYDEPQNQEPVKKGKNAGTINLGSGQVIRVVTDENVVSESIDNDTMVVAGSYMAVLQDTNPNIAVLILNTKQEGEEPLLILDGRIATIDQVRAIPRDSVASVATMRESAAIRSYGEKGRNGALIITTVKHQQEIDNELITQLDVFDNVEEVPQFPGGIAGLLQYLSSNIRYPQDAEEAGTEGRVIVSFIVEKDGSISNARVTKPTCSSLDKEALRVVSAMPKWTPGKQNGEAVRVRYSLPVSFRLNDEKTLTAVGTFTPTATGTFTPTATGTFTPAESADEQVEIDKEGRIIVNGKEVKRYLIEHPIDNNLTRFIANIMINDPEHFDYEIDGEPVTADYLKERKPSKNNPIKSIEYVQKDSEHPKDRLLIHMVNAE